MKDKTRRFFILVKQELFKYAINPAIYIAGAVFFIFLALNFYYIHNFFIQNRGSTDTRYFFICIPYISILFIPVLTMNSWVSDDDFTLFLPLSIFATFTAKWFAAFIVFGICVTITLVVPFSVIFFGDISLSRIFCSCFGVLLFASASIAFAQWTAVLTKNSIASFIITAFSLAIINSIHLIPLSIQLPYYLQSACNFLSFSWHFDAASKGILDTRDCTFFIIITFFFLIQSRYITKKRMHSTISTHPIKHKNKNLTISISFFLAIILINSQLFYTRIDTTSEKQFSLAPITKELIQNLPDTLHIRYYLSSSLKNLYPQIRDVQDLLYEYANFSPAISLEIINPKGSDIKKNLLSAGLESQQIKITEKNHTSITDVFSGIVLECGGQTEIIPFVLSTITFEYTIDSALQFFLNGKKRSVYVLCGGEETLEENFSYLGSWLESSGFDWLEISEEDLIYTQNINIRSPLIVLGNSAISTNGVAAIERFVMSGGKTFFAVSSIVADKSSWKVEPLFGNQLIELLDFWGFSIKTALVQDEANFKITMQAQNSTDIQLIKYPFWITTQKKNVSKNSPITSFFTNFEVYWACPLEIYPSDKLKIEPLVQTTNNAWLQLPMVSDSEPFITDPFYTNYTVDTYEKNQYILAASAEGHVRGWTTVESGNKTRIVVCSNQYFPSNMIEYTNSPHNLDFLTNALLWLTNEDALLQVKAKGNINT
ncbi:MAG TPA: GldG family protein, partial [Treponemataceae bacterium]|nr:GldG family protein [Treponemataceae bacterium]